MIDTLVKEAEALTTAPVEQKLNLLQKADICKLTKEDFRRLAHVLEHWIVD